MGQRAWGGGIGEGGMRRLEFEKGYVEVEKIII
jgi:hypothetical protein